MFIKLLIKTKRFLSRLSSTLITKLVLWCFLVLVFLSCSSSDSPGENLDQPNTINNESETPKVEEPVEIESFDNFEQKVSNLMTRLNLRGGQIAITHNEKLVYLGNFGNIDDQSDSATSENSLFRIASVSKPITAIAILKLVSENKLSLTDKVFGSNSILGNEYGTLEYSTLEKRIEVGHLLAHTSGFTNNPSDVMFDDLNLSQTELIDLVLDERELLHSPGSNYYYSNFGFCVLGRIIETVSGENYEDYVREQILKPIGISEALVGGNTLEERKINEVKYYSTWFSPYAMNVTRMDSHGGWIASAKNLARFVVHTDGAPGVRDFLDYGDMQPYFENGFGGHNGALPGSLSGISTGPIFSYAFVFNSGHSSFESDLGEIRKLISDEILMRKDWPQVDLFQ